MINFTWGYRTSDETFRHLSSVCYGNTFCPHRKKLKLLEMTHKTDGKQMQLEKQCMPSYQQICSSAPPVIFMSYVMCLIEKLRMTVIICSSCFVIFVGHKNTIKWPYGDFMAVHSDHVCQASKRQKHHKMHPMTIFDILWSTQWLYKTSQASHTVTKSVCSS